MKRRSFLSSIPFIGFAIERALNSKAAISIVETHSMKFEAPLDLKTLWDETWHDVSEEMPYSRESHHAYKKRVISGWGNAK